MNIQNFDNNTLLNEQGMTDYNQNATVLNNQRLSATDGHNATVFNDSITESTLDNIIGKTIAENYIVESLLGDSSAEAYLFICTDKIRKYVLKIYKRKSAIKKDVIEKLKTIDSPYVTKVICAGIHEGYPYEIIPYYKKGSLQGKTFTYEQLKGRIIPELNKGLKILHDIGIIHKDLKPSNIMITDDGKDVVIIDFGTSSIMENGNTVIQTKLGMTPQYSAPETYRGLFLSESDYYSLGIVLYELFFGRTPYEFMQAEDLEKYVTLQTIPFPKDMNEDLKVLIRALTYNDITNRRDKSNPNRRWGYEETKKWCEGIKQPIPGEVAGISYVSGDIKPYKFLEKKYNDRASLISALADNWEQGKKHLFRGLLCEYFKKFDEESAGFCMDAEEVKKGEEDITFFKTIYKLDPNMTSFCWKGNRYDSIVDIGEKLLKHLWAHDSSMEQFLDDVLVHSVLSQYILCMNKNSEREFNVVKSIESLYRTNREDSRKKEKLFFQLAYMLTKRGTLHLDRKEFNSLQELSKFLTGKYTESFEEFGRICRMLIDNNQLDAQFEAWLWFRGKTDQIKQWYEKVKEFG